MLSMPSQDPGGQAQPPQAPCVGCGWRDVAGLCLLHMGDILALLPPAAPGPQGLEVDPSCAPTRCTFGSAGQGVTPSALGHFLKFVQSRGSACGTEATSDLQGQSCHPPP